MLVLVLLAVVIGCSDEGSGSSVVVVVEVVETFRRKSLSFRRCFSTKLGVCLATALFSRLIDEVINGVDECDEGDVCC